MHSIRRPIFCVAFILLVVAGLAVLRAADRAPALPETESIAKALEGVWVHVGEPGNVRPAPKSGGRLKSRISNRWTFTQADSATGEVKAHFGGS